MNKIIISIFFLLFLTSCNYSYDYSYEDKIKVEAGVEVSKDKIIEVEIVEPVEKIDFSYIDSTYDSLDMLYNLDRIHNQKQAMKVLFPTGTPEYGFDLGISFDDPVGSQEILVGMYKELKSEVKKNNPEAFQQYIDLASNPYGISCEFCCGVGPIGADEKGNSRCGCNHASALQSITIYLADKGYSDEEILREAMKWKTVWFPQVMLELVLGYEVDDDIPVMVGSC
tara:strand:+ start:412 stop:1089 length:678 start_codon:yes stop_codon:yes gene_type:complete